MFSLKKFIAGAHSKGGVASLNDMPSSISDLTFDLGVSNATLYLDSTGNLRLITQGAGSSDLGSWHSPEGTPDKTYHANVTYVSGDATYTSGSGLNTWVALTTNRLWSFSISTYTSKTGVYRIRLSGDGGPTTIGDKNFTVSLEASVL